VLDSVITIASKSEGHRDAMTAVAGLTSAKVLAFSDLGSLSRVQTFGSLDARYCAVESLNFR
jgi:hypothetical protein